MVKIYGIDEKLNPVKSGISDLINEAFTESISFPADKRIHRFFPMKREDFFYPVGRTDAYTMIEISMMEGRSVEAKKNLIKNIFLKLQTGLNISPADVEISITEQPPHCWGFRGITGDEAVLSYKVDV